MLDLTFGEQVKIILRRKGMTIKELAEKMEEETGKKMSRQNLTQRLGRDNFQEQDMRQIAEILGCQFRLSILDDSVSAEKEVISKKEKIEVNTESASEYERDITIGELVAIHDELDELEQTLNEEAEESVSVCVPEEVREEPVYEEEFAEPVYEEAYEEPVYEEPVYEEAYEEPVYEEAYEEPVYEEEYVEETEETASVEDILREMEELERESKEQHSVVKEKKPTGWKSYLQRRRKKDEQPAEVKEEPAVQEEPVVEEVAAEPAEEENVLYLEEDEGVEITGVDVAEEAVGDINPYTGREYESNSVRIHPKRIGYVQVYDRGEHKWTDMTEWAFLGYQERKKALLGKDYDPPIYLD